MDIKCLKKIDDPFKKKILKIVIIFTQMNYIELAEKTLNNGKYKLETSKNLFLGQGKFGEVLKATNTETNKPVALKRIIKTNILYPKQRKYFKKEIEIIVRFTRNE